MNWKKFFKSVLLKIAIVLVLIYGGLVFLFYVVQDSFLFYPRPVSKVYENRFKKFEWALEHDGVRLSGWLLNPGSKNLLIYYGGNAEELSYLIDDFEKYEGMSVLLVNYRGFGNSTGTPSQEAFFKDALAIYDKVAPDFDSIALAGRSLGSGVAVYVSSQRKVVSTVLITPYDSMVKVAQHLFGWLPIKMILKHPFPSEEYAPKIDTPTLFLVAGKDTIIVKERSENLYKEWSGDKEWKVYPYAGHNGISVNQSKDPTIHDYLKKCFQKAPTK